MRCLEPFDGEIVEQTDYSRHTYQQLLAEIEHYADIMRGASPMHLDWVLSPARAIVARAEAAEASLIDARRENDAMYSRARDAEARVAELEAELAGDIQAVTADGQQHRIPRGNWRPYAALVTLAPRRVATQDRENQK